MDLVRPASIEQAKVLVKMYAGAEPELQQRDFYNSLLAAFEIEEIQNQLAAAEMDMFAIRQISDRHVVVAGEAP